MPTARKLPSGSWRCRVYDYTDISGKKHYQSFTADSKTAAELLATEWKHKNQHRNKKEDITVADAIDRYITAKSQVLSVSTVRGYRQMQNKYYESIGSVRVSRLTTEELQLFVSSLSGSVSAKSVANIYGLLISAVTMFRPDAVFRVTMPKKTPPKRQPPSDNDIRILFNAADGDLKICIALAAFGSLRRGEICALKYSDIDGCRISVHADMVENSDNKFVYKEIPKTSDSIRTAVIPPEAAALIPSGPPDDFLIQRSPNAVTHAFIKLAKKHSIDIRFHDLRHYYASVGAALNIPDTYLSDFGGWRRGSGVLKAVYQGAMEDTSAKLSKQLSDHFSSVICHKI